MSDQWWVAEANFLSMVMQHGSPTEAARALGGISERSARERYQKLRDASSAPSSVRATPAPVEIEVSTSRWTPEEVLAGEGLDPADFIITHVKPNRWEAVVGDGEVREMHQLKVVAQRRVDSLIGINLPDGWQPPKARRRSIDGKPTVIPLFGDPHFPMHEPALYEASLAWLEEFNPSRVICMGDEGDWSPFKRHKRNPRTDTSTGEALIGTFNGLAGWAHAAGGVPFDLIPGNHTKWLESRIAENMPELIGFTRPGDDVPMHSLRHVLKLDDLGITYHETTGEYFDAVINLADDLVLMHGTKTGKHGGSIKEHDGWEGSSVAQGHDHSLALTAISKRTASGYTQRYAISTGAMSLRDLGYTSTHDVDQGFAVITMWPDGRWHPDFALFNPQTQETTWRNWRYAAN